MSTPVSKLQQLANQLKEMDVKAAEPEVNLIMYLLNSLGAEWESWVSSIMANADKFTFDDVVNKLLLEEARRNSSDKQDHEEANIARAKPSWRRNEYNPRNEDQNHQSRRPYGGSPMRRPIKCFECGGPHPAFKCPGKPME